MHSNRFPTLSSKKSHWWSHKSGLWMHCHLHGPSTAVRHSDCRVSSPMGPRGRLEVCSLSIHILLYRITSTAAPFTCQCTVIWSTVFKTSYYNETLHLNTVCDRYHIAAITIQTWICELSMQSVNKTAHLKMFQSMIYRCITMQLVAVWFRWCHCSLIHLKCTYVYWKRYKTLCSPHKKIMLNAIKFK